MMKFRIVLGCLPWLLAACSVPSSDHAGASAPGAATSTAGHRAQAAAGTNPSLQAYHWRLQTAVDATGQPMAVLLARPDTPLQLDFDAGRLQVTHACNRMAAGYREVGDTLQPGPLVSTRKACTDPALQALDGAIARVLSGPLAMKRERGRDGPLLRLVTDTGDTLVFAGEPTAQTRYGNPGETLFLEVAAQTVPCAHPISPHAQCLEVRRRQYDASGRGRPVGDWYALAQPIDGYVHEAGIRNVLRVKRYPVDDARGDASAGAYVLDTVIESETVGE